MLWIVIVTASVLAAVSGLLLSGRLASVASAQGNGYIFTVFAAAVIGGISLNGGKGTIFGAFTGVLLLYLIQNVLTLAGVPAQWIGALNGASSSSLWSSPASPEERSKNDQGDGSAHHRRSYCVARSSGAGEGAAVGSHYAYLT